MNQASPTDLYIAGRMSEEDARLFEEHMLVNPAIAAEVDVRRRIKSGLRLLESRGELAAYSAAPRPLLVPWAAAASAALVVIASAWYLDQPSSPDTGPNTTQSVMLASLRSSEVPFVVRLESATRTLSLGVLLDVDASPPYSMRIREVPPGNRTIELSGDAVKTVGEQIEGLIAVDKLAPGRYELIVVTGTGASQPVPFEIEK